MSDKALLITGIITTAVSALALAAGFVAVKMRELATRSELLLKFGRDADESSAPDDDVPPETADNESGV